MSSSDNNIGLYGKKRLGFYSWFLICLSIEVFGVFDVIVLNNIHSILMGVGFALMMIFTPLLMLDKHKGWIIKN